jgi:hypothetical protein
VAGSIEGSLADRGKPLRTVLSPIWDSSWLCRQDLEVRRVHQHTGVSCHIPQRILSITPWHILSVQKRIKEFPHKLSTSGWDVGATKLFPTTGFNGTIDSRKLLSLSVNHVDLQE